MDAFQYIYFPLERPGRSQLPTQAIQRYLRRRFIAKTATWIPLVPTSNARSSTLSLSCCSVAQLLHLVEGAMEVGNRGDSAMEVEAEVSLFAAETSGSPVPGGVGSSTRRLGLKNSIQTNFGDDYVFQIASWSDKNREWCSFSLASSKFFLPVAHK
ncbi:uncharacterized protein LOC125521948 isoform X1 [Triticum urartu]|uniref:uncharacterized protein LOC125521948 isoform X1 n=1 Tax=Triticum urartu TaxID=4572 RepID=UPI0020433B3F|nr:uncharacterized protein LOC125521948 isoform X1 [Triticum urartu]